MPSQRGENLSAVPQWMVPVFITWNTNNTASLTKCRNIKPYMGMEQCGQKPKHVRKHRSMTSHHHTLTVITQPAGHSHIIWVIQNFIHQIRLKFSKSGGRNDFTDDSQVSSLSKRVCGSRWHRWGQRATEEGGTDGRGHLWVEYWK